MLSEHKISFTYKLTTLKVSETLGLANALGFPLPFGKAQRITKEGPQTANRKQKCGYPAAQLNIHIHPPAKNINNWLVGGKNMVIC